MYITTCVLLALVLDSPPIDAATLSVWLLGGLTVAVQGAFVAFFLYLRRQTKLTAANELDLEWSRLQRGSKHAWRRCQ